MKKMLAILLALAMFMPLALSVSAVDMGGIKAFYEKEVPEEVNPFSVYTGPEPERSENKSMPYKSDGTFYIFAADNYNYGPGTGMASYDLSTGAMQHMPYGINKYIHAGAYVWEENGGAFYGIYNQDTTNFMLARFDDIEYDDHTDICAAPEQILAMSVDYAHNVIYAMGLSFNLYVIDIQNGIFMQCSKLYGYDMNPMVMAVDASGVMYIVTLSGNMYTVDANSGLCTLFGSTGIVPGYMQCMTYDHNSNEMYWFYFMEDGTAGLCTVDLATAQTTPIHSFNGVEVLCAYSIPSHIDFPKNSVETTGVELNLSRVAVMGGEQVQLSGIVKPLDGYVASRSLVWEVDDESIATVSEDGLVTGIYSGLAIVTATTKDGKASAECIVTVENVQSRFGAINTAMNTVESGQPGWQYYRTDSTKYPFTVLNEQSRGLHTVSGNAGIANSESWIENVFPVHMTGGSTLTFDYKVSTEEHGDRLVLSANGVNVFYASGEKDWDTFTYTVPKTGDYKFKWSYIKNGSVNSGKDTVYIDNVQYDIKDLADSLTGITVEETEAELVVGAKYQINVGYMPANTEVRDVTFTSDNASVASVNSNGRVIARANGQATITATCEGHTAKVTVKVADAKDITDLNFKKIEVNNAYPANFGGIGSQYIYHNDKIKYAAGYSIDMKYGEGAKFTVTPGCTPLKDTVMTVYDKDFNQVAYNDDANEGTSYSALTFVPTVDGTYYIVVTTSAAYTVDNGDIVLNVDAYDPVHVTGITVPETLTIGMGRYVKLDAVLAPENNDYPQITYTSSDISVVTVNENGTLYGVSEGTAEVTATSFDGNHSATARVTVEKVENPDPDGMIYLYCYTDNEKKFDRGFLSYDPVTQEFKQVSYDDNDYYTGIYLNGILYGYRINQEFNVYTVEYITIDAINFELQTCTAMTEKLIPVDMTYDYTTDTVYATILDFDTQANSFGTVDLATGTVNPVKRFNDTMLLNIEATDDGSLYGIGTDAGLYSVDKATGALEYISGMTISTNMISSLVYDYEAKIMYWFPMTNTDYSSFVIVFDPETGDFDAKDPTGRLELTCGFMYRDYNSEPHTVEFLGLKHEVVDTVTVEHGRAAQAPDMTHPDGIPFGMWDKDFSAVVEDMQVQGYYIGDANMNADLDSGDATIMLRGVVGAIELSKDQMLLADANSNGNIDSGDATILLRYIVGMGWTAK